MITVTLLAFWRSDAPAQASQRTLTFAERVAYQRYRTLVHVFYENQLAGSLPSWRFGTPVQT